MRINYMFLFYAAVTAVVLYLIYGAVSSYMKRHKEPDLRQACINEYGEDFAKLYDTLNEGGPIGGYVYTVAVISAIEDVKKKLENGEISDKPNVKKDESHELELLE